MLEMILVVAIGLIGGIAVGTQAPIAGAMAQRVGGASSSFIVHIVGTVASAALLLIRGGEQIHQWRELPWYMLGCGLLGLVLYLSLGQTVPKLGAAAAVTLVIVGQLAASILIDHFGAFGIPVRSLDANRIMAALLLFAGAYMMIR